MRFTQAKRRLSQAASSIKYDTKICILINVFKLFPTDVKFVISSSIFTETMSSDFFNVNFQTLFNGVFV